MENTNTLVLVNKCILRKETLENQNYFEKMRTRKKKLFLMNKETGYINHKKNKTKALLKHTGIILQGRPKRKGSQKRENPTAQKPVNPVNTLDDSNKLQMKVLFILCAEKTTFSKATLFL